MAELKWTDTDKGYNKFAQAVAGSYAVVKVGVDDRPHGDLATDELGMLHEQGLGVPERSFLRSWVSQHEAEIQEKIDEAVGSITQGPEAFRAALHRFAEWAVVGVKAQIMSNIPPALSAETVKRKGHDLALVDTFTLFNAVVYEIDSSHQ
jgi:hypothetical protein